jgi:hypothetical protein
VGDTYERLEDALAEDVRRAEREGLDLTNLAGPELRGLTDPLTMSRCACCGYFRCMYDPPRYSSRQPVRLRKPPEYRFSARSSGARNRERFAMLRWTFDRLEHALTEEQRRAHESAAWQQVEKQMAAMSAFVRGTPSEREAAIAYAKALRRKGDVSLLHEMYPELKDILNAPSLGRRGKYQRKPRLDVLSARRLVPMIQQIWKKTYHRERLTDHDMTARDVACCYYSIAKLPGVGGGHGARDKKNQTKKVRAIS